MEKVSDMLATVMEKLQKYLKNKTLLIALAVVVVLVVLGGAFFFISSSKSQPQQQQAAVTPMPTDTPVPSIDPSSLGITLTEGPGDKVVTLKISQTQDLTAVSYELSYNATVNGEQVARGAIGDITIKSPGSPVSQDITLGTCSDVCHYDTGITDIKLTLKITKTDGKAYQAELSAGPTSSQ